jgi:quercetin dioxygenase-like cupin family protein
MTVFAKALVAAGLLFLGPALAPAPPASGKRLRLVPKAIAALPPLGAGTGTSGVSGIRTRVLQGDPNGYGLYTIELEVPAHTRIEAHTHPDDRVVTVVSGVWSFGYGSRFDAKALKPLPPGSFYTEPPDVAHFAHTGATAVRVRITGYGPSGTVPAGGR